MHVSMLQISVLHRNPDAESLNWPSDWPEKTPRLVDILRHGKKVSPLMKKKKRNGSKVRALLRNWGVKQSMDRHRFSSLKHHHLWFWIWHPSQLASPFLIIFPPNWVADTNAVMTNAPSFGKRGLFRTSQLRIHIPSHPKLMWGSTQLKLWVRTTGKNNHNMLLLYWKSVTSRWSI